MMQQKEPEICYFGHLPDGRIVETVTIGHGSLRAEILTFGAIIRDLRFEGHHPPLVLGLNTIEDYLNHSRNFGASIGRCANRICKGKFMLDGIAYQLECNDKGGVNHIHGGSNGMARSLWTIRELTAHRVVLWIRDPAGNAGYPGMVETLCTIEISDMATLAIRYESQCDAPTLVNICHHGYFNLGHRSDVLDHTVSIAADSYLEVDAHQIPLNLPCHVDGTKFDLRKPTLLRDCFVGFDGGFDHNFCLSQERLALRPVAFVQAPDGIAMEVATTEPGVQFFTAATVQCPVAGLEGRRYGAFAGLCLETQIWPDAINHADFPTALLRPDEYRTQETRYQFSKISDDS